MRQNPANVDLHLGLRIWPVDPMSDLPISMRLQRGVSVLYGQNGAGKTTILEAWRCALSGRRGRLPVELYMEMPQAVGFFGGHGALVDRGDQGSDEKSEEDDGLALPVKRPFEASDRSMWGFAWTPSMVDSVADEDWAAHNSVWDDDFARAVLSTGKVALVPVGVESPQWEVWLAADMTHEAMRPFAERARRALSTCQATLSHLRALDDDDRTSEAEADEASEQFEEAFQAILTDPLFRYLQQDLLNARWDDTTSMVDDFIDEAVHAGIPAQPVDTMPVPVALLGTAKRLPWPQLLYEVDDETLDRMVIIGATRGADADDPVHHVGEFAEQASERANSIMADLLPNAVRLTVEVARRERWLLGGALRWKAADDPPRPWGYRPLAEFSAGQSRWARIAALLATAPTAGQIQDYGGGNQETPMSVIRGVPRVLILDEPEAHLHRSAERTLARGLRRLADGEVDYLLVASHSPELLNVADAHLHWANELGIRPFAGADVKRLEELGLLPSDLLAMTRVILLVEGHHEEVIFESLIGDSLRRSGTYVLPMNKGSRLASVADSQVLFDFTDAKIIGLLDNLRAVDVQSLWNDAIALRTERGRAAAVDHLNKSLPSKEKSENIFMKQWLTKAIDAEVPASRIVPFGLAKSDVVQYLPVKAFLPKADSWEDLEEEHQAQIESGRLKKPELVRGFKAWLTATKGARFTDDAIREAVASLDYIPDDFVRLAEACESASVRPATVEK